MENKQKTGPIGVGTRDLTFAAVSAALIFVVTRLAMVPVPATQAYVNAGDLLIYICAFLFGGPAAGISAALGSALADLAGGYAVYAPATFVIKGLMGLVAGFIIGKKPAFVPFLIACLAGGVIMAGGYALFENLMFGAEYMLAALPGNLIQAACGVAACAFYAPLKRLRIYI